MLPRISARFAMTMARSRSEREPAATLTTTMRPPRSQAREVLREIRPADEIEHDIHTVALGASEDFRSEWAILDADHDAVRQTERTGSLDLAAPDRADGACPHRPGDLNGSRPDAPARGVDEDRLSRFEARLVDQGVPGREKGFRQRPPPA